MIEAAGGISVTYEKSDIRAGELNPIVYFETVEIVGDGIINHSSTRGQNIQMEISPNTYITINSHARNILTANFYAELRRLFDFADTLVASDPRVIADHFRSPHYAWNEGLGEYVLRPGLVEGLQAEVDRFLADEQAVFLSAIHNRFNTMLRTVMEHAEQAQREHTNMGSRMARLEMVGIQLEEDEVAFTDLLSQNEDTDLAGTIKRKDGAEAAFQHALMAIARTTQLTLADFINR
jgi:flagellin-like hook-associated protein FlgL